MPFNGLLVIGERTNTNGSRAFKELLEREDYDGMVSMAKEQVREGARVLDVRVASVGRDEAKDFRGVLQRLAAQVPEVPLMIDSTDVAVVEAALQSIGSQATPSVPSGPAVPWSAGSREIVPPRSLRAHGTEGGAMARPGRSPALTIVNSIHFGDGVERIDRVMPLVVQYGARVVGLTIDEEGMAKTADRKLQVARRLYETVTNRFGLDPAHLLIDPLTFPIDRNSAALTTLEGIRRIKAALPGVLTLLGLSNISFGLPPDARVVLNSVFLHHALEAGLDAAIMNAKKVLPLHQLDGEARELARQLIFNERASQRPHGPAMRDPGIAGDPLAAFLARCRQLGDGENEG